MFVFFKTQQDAKEEEYRLAHEMRMAEPAARDEESENEHEQESFAWEEEALRMRYQHN